MLRLLLALGAILGAVSTAQKTTPAIRVDGQQIFRDVDKLAGDDMEGRLVGSPGSERARKYLIERFHQSGVKPLGAGYERPFTFSSRGAEQRGTNLVGVIRGAASPDRFVVLTAHYDHIGVRNGVVFNGADDNASGVAALLAVAAYFSRNVPAHSFLVVACDAEEVGLQGAKALMRDPPVPIASMVLNINLDMVGRDPGNKLFATGIHYFPYLKPYLEHVAQPPVVLAFGHDVPGEREDWTKDSDHYVFHQAGIPWVFFGVEDFDQHHKATDDAATIGKEFLASVSATVIAAVHEYDSHLEEIAKRRE